MKFEVVLTLIVTTHDQESAQEIAIDACEHLNDTYNDDGSLSPYMGWTVKPLPEGPK